MLLSADVAFVMICKKWIFLRIRIFMYIMLYYFYQLLHKIWILKVCDRWSLWLQFQIVWVIFIWCFCGLYSRCPEWDADEATLSCSHGPHPLGPGVLGRQAHSDHDADVAPQESHWGELHHHEPRAGRCHSCSPHLMWRSQLPPRLRSVSQNSASHTKYSIALDWQILLTPKE